MSSVFQQMVRAGELLYDLSRDLSEWSQKTFGDDQTRGPSGALKHLSKEAMEAWERPNDPFEYADCLILILDASRRAGYKPIELLEFAIKKMEINKSR